MLTNLNVVLYVYRVSTKLSYTFTGGELVNKSVIYSVLTIIDLLAHALLALAQENFRNYVIHYNFE